jgi:hypothetical protein
MSFFGVVGYLQKYRELRMTALITPSFLVVFFDLLRNLYKMVRLRTETTCSHTHLHTRRYARVHVYICASACVCACCTVL